MAIQLNVVQSTGATASYHVVNYTVMDVLHGSVSARIDSWFDQPHHADGSPSMSSTMIDITPLAQAPAVTPTMPTFSQQLIDAVEKYLIAQTDGTYFNGTQVA